MKLTTVGIDLARNVFQIHGVDQHGKVILKKQLKRSRMAAFFVNLPVCLIGMEACDSAHHWARELEKMGHTVKLMAPQFVKPYVKTNKNDMADAEAICEAVTRPNMRFVPIKTIEQQAVLSLHRVRQGFVKARTAQSNQVRGLLGEFGLVLPKGVGQIAQRIPEILEVQVKAWHRESPASLKLAEVPGIGPLTATALVASVGNARQPAAWLGLVPRQHSTGGKSVLLGISKRGDSYLRTLLIHGARPAIQAALRKVDQGNAWLAGLLQRRNSNIAAVALANKNARIVWALLAHDRDHLPGYAGKPA